MSRVLLKEVKSTNDKGLVGITEGGEEVLLSDPKPRLVFSVCVQYCKRGVLNRSSKKQEYIQFGENKFMGVGNIGLSYNIYTKRE